MGMTTTLWEDGCFRIEDEGGLLWVTELLHGRQGDVHKRWRIRFESPENASRFIAARLRDSHNSLYHFHIEPTGVTTWDVG